MKKLFKMKKSKNGKKAIKISAFLLPAVILTFFAAGGSEYMKSIQDAKNYVTVSFDTNGGKDISSVVIDKGTVMKNIPCADKENSFFTGWCYDEQLTQPFFSDDKLEENTTLYASYTDSENEEEVYQSEELYLDDCDASSSVVIHSENEITEENLSEYLTVDSYLGEIPEGFTVKSLGNGDYEVVPNQNYEAGCTYDFSVSNGASFVTEKGEGITTLSQRIHKDESEIVELKNEVAYLDWDDVVRNGSDYKLYIPQSDTYKLSENTPLCLLNGYNEWVAEGSNEDTFGSLFEDNCLFITVESVSCDFMEQTISGQTISGDNWYYVEARDGDLEDIISDVDVYEQFDVSAKELIDVEELEKNISESEGIQQLADFVSCAVMDDEEFIKMAKNNPADQSGDFSVFSPLTVSAAEGNTKLFRDGVKMGDSKNLKVPVVGTGVTVTVKFDGDSASNPNFGICDIYDRDNNKWCALKVAVNVEREIKGVAVSAVIDITEYLKVTMQGYKDWDGVKVDFDYAANMYSQTNFDFSVKIRSDGNTEWLDISDSINNNLGSAEMIEKYKEMINADGGYIDIVDVELIGADYPVIPLIPIFDVHLGLSFVLKFDLSAGINSSFTYLDATQVGMKGKTGEAIKSYNHELMGANRYSYYMDACGYLGVKTGLEGKLTLAFHGLRKLGEVGIAIELGVYADLYGYMSLSVEKKYQESRLINTSFSGGYYLEMGMYLEVELIACSQTFKAKAGLKILDEKWKLFSLGNRYIACDLTGSRNSEYMLHSNSGNVLEICGISANCLDLKTGDVVEKKLSELGKFYVSPSDWSFNIDYDNMKLWIDEKIPLIRQKL